MMSQTFILSSLDNINLEGFDLKAFCELHKLQENKILVGPLKDLANGSDAKEL